MACVKWRRAAANFARGRSCFVLISFLDVAGSVMSENLVFVVVVVVFFLYFSLCVEGVGNFWKMFIFFL